MCVFCKMPSSTLLSRDVRKFLWRRQVRHRSDVSVTTEIVEGTWSIKSEFVLLHGVALQCSCNINVTTEEEKVTKL